MRLFPALLALIACAGAIPVAATELLITDATVYAAPGVAPIENGAVLVRDGRIVAVGPAGEIAAADGAPVIDVDDDALLAGFWNSHVHFTEPHWAGAAALPATRLQSQLQEMLVRYGFTSVVDLGSDPRDTGPMRKRIESGEIAGPRIVMAGSPLYPPEGVPYYVRNALPPELLPLLSTPATPQEAAATVRRHLDGGAEVIKLFTGSWAVEGASQSLPMPVEIATAAVVEAHGRDALVFAHPSDVGGLEVALDAGVDVLAHAVEDLDGFTPAHLQRMHGSGVVIVPTLELFSRNAAFDEVLRQVGDYRRMGGDLWFGTDVGYLEEYGTAPEFELLQRAGLSFDEILAALTTAPASRLPGGAARARIEPGLVADLVVLDGDPRSDVGAWSRVRYTIRDGRTIYAADDLP